jgi:hypothetical protein
MNKAQKLWELAAWYREFAERAGNPWVWEARLKLAEDLEREPALSEPQPRRMRRPPFPNETDSE